MWWKKDDAFRESSSLQARDHAMNVPAKDTDHKIALERYNKSFHETGQVSSMFADQLSSFTRKREANTALCN
jgi:hypothetical protein